ncbi:MAG TPA: hypothetical protein VIY28_01860 [Pseudonocardiaceae bacterium]
MTFTGWVGPISGVGPTQFSAQQPGLLIDHGGRAVVVRRELALGTTGFDEGARRLAEALTSAVRARPRAGRHRHPECVPGTRGRRRTGGSREPREGAGVRAGRTGSK